MHHHRCPTCQRKFKSIRDYPRVLVLSFERLPVPEAVDRLSEAAAEKWLALKRSEGRAADWSGHDGINRTPEIASACAQTEAHEYLKRLEQLTGQIVETAQITPPFKRSGRFKWAHSIPETELFLSLTGSQKGVGSHFANEPVHVTGAAIVGLSGWTKGTGLVCRVVA